ncbi:MAG TPA: hypothetical protein VFV93_05360 [Thermomicrobiales bacterium]|nr:hypothetical protein [Thermomicrobiales bacterium]
MGAASLSPRTTEVTVDDLLAVGFTDDQIERLQALKNAYPFIEYVDTAKQWRRLEFLKWRYLQGDLQRA